MRVDLLFMKLEIKDEILNMYIEGADVETISAWTGIMPEEVNEILDHLTPLL